MEIMAYLIIGAFSSIIIGIGIYYLIRYMKGSLKIQLEKNSYNAGETIKGVIKLKAKKEIESQRLFTALVQYTLQRTYTSKGNRNQWRETFREEKTIENEKIYRPGFSNQYNFKINIAFKEGANNEILKTVGNVLKTFTGTGRTKWKIEARVDAKGVDLFTTQKVRINENIQSTISN